MKVRRLLLPRRQATGGMTPLRVPGGASFRKPRVYYNEIDKFAAAWLRELIKQGLIAPGEVDERDIRDVAPDDLVGFVQCHFFAGVGVWSYALRRAGWPDDRAVWTGSCPCPPFSAAGKGQKCPECGSKSNICHPRKTGHFVCLDCGCDRHADDRHLWPEFARLIRECDPAIVFGEQVASADGRLWLAAIRADLETMGRAVGGADLCAAGVGAHHIRQRLWWGTERLANAERRGFESRIERSGAPAASVSASDSIQGGVEQSTGDGRDERWAEPSRGSTSSGCGAGRLADSGGERRQQVDRSALGDEGPNGRWPEGNHVIAGPREDGWLALANGRECEWFADGKGRQHDRQTPGWIESHGEPAAGGELCRLGITDCGGPSARGEATTAGGYRHPTIATGGLDRPRSPDGFWRDADWLFCRDGKWRPVEPGTFPLAHGASARVGRLRGYGNAIVAQAAQAFIESYLDTRMINLVGEAA